MTELTTPAALATSPLDSLWVVWSFEHDAWWASNSCGYVQSLLLAGTYSEKEAKEIAEGSAYGNIVREEARRLTEALEAECVRWGRRGGMVIDALLAAPRHADQAADNFDMMAETWGRERDDSTRYWHALKAISDFKRAYGEEWSGAFNELQRLARAAIEPSRNAAVREPNRNESTTPRAEAGGASQR